MGQHGRNRTGSDATRGSRVHDTERHDDALSEGANVEGYAPAFGGPGDPPTRPLPGIVGTGPAPVAGAPDSSPRAGFDGVNRRVRQEEPEVWAANERRRAPWSY